MKIIDVKQAAKIAVEYFESLYAEHEITNVLLEEVDFDEEENVWLITIGFSLPTKESKVSGFPTSYEGERKYKIFKIHDVTGEVLSMKIRTLQHA